VQMTRFILFDVNFILQQFLFCFFIFSASQND